MPALRLGHPIWLDRTTRSRQRRYPNLRGHLDADAAIVGGGITGAVIAAQFAAAGVRVALVEAALAGHGSTAASTALLMQEPDKGLLELGKRYGPADAVRIWKLSHRAARDFVLLLRDLDIDCDLVPRDSIYYTTRADAVAPLRRDYDRRRRAGFAADWLEGEEVQRAGGVVADAAIRTKGNAQLDPYKACIGLLGAAAAAGAQIFERSPVSRIDPQGQQGQQDRQGAGVRVVTHRGTIDARHVIIATGYATPAFQPLVGRFEMKHTYVVGTRRIGARRRHGAGPANVMLWDTQRPYHYARWTADNRLLFGGGDRTLMPERRRATAFRDAVGELRVEMATLFPGIAADSVEYAWEGLFALTPDGLPYIGPHRHFPRHLFALGYGGNGMTFAFLAARLLLESFQGRTSPDQRLFAFNRIRR